MQVTPKKNYSRYFIILQEDEKGYSLDADKTPSGYAKLEMKNSKCKISYYVQNLRKEKQPYHMILICGKKDVNKIIKVGKLNIDDHGRVDISYEYDMDNIADTAISSEKIIGAAIVKFLDANVISIMSGFSTTDKPNDWKNYKLADSNIDKKETRTEDEVNEFDEYEQNIELIKLKSNDLAKQVNVQENVINQEDVNEEVVKEADTKQRVEAKNTELLETKEGVNEEVVKETDTKQRVEAKNVELLETQEDVNEEADKEADTKQRVKAESVEPLEKTEKADEEDSDVRLRVKAESVETTEQLEEEIQVDKSDDGFDVRDKNKKHHKEYNEDKKYDCDHKENKKYKEKYPIGDTGNFFKAVAKDFDEVPDFTKEIKWCKWYKVPVHNLENMYNLRDYNKYTIVYYPMICYYPYIRNHKSFMLGYKCDSSGEMKYIIYGIPGSRAKAHQPYGGKTGFVTWISDKDNDEMGHWLMFYDFKNSTIVVPVKK